ncbi:hypothetical protein [Alkalihalobacterium bogoriense]|uniref:hypothetical protein n=1 Tax=Alkalihalobacterium bogoriense TaxID=246272 RepID=UPI00047EF94A|nr:hypothetical protein [Alkalihalobacterium bogoriense]
MNKLQEKLLARVDWFHIIISSIMLFAIFFFPDPFKAIVIVCGFIATMIVVIYNRKKLKDDNKKNA